MRPALKRSFSPTSMLSASEVLLVRGGSDRGGRLAWYFMRVSNTKARAFHSAVKQGHVNLMEFGEILTSGYGETPPDSIVADMRLRYAYKGDIA